MKEGRTLSTETWGIGVGAIPWVTSGCPSAWRGFERPLILRLFLMVLWSSLRLLMHSFPSPLCYEPSNVKRRTQLRSSWQEYTDVFQSMHHTRVFLVPSYTMVSLLLPAILQSSHFYPHFTDDEHKHFSEHQNYLEDLLKQNFWACLWVSDPASLS